MEQRTPLHFVLKLHHERSRHFNDPIVTETTNGVPLSNQCLTIYAYQGGLRRLTYEIMHRDPMTYVLLWPCGEPD